MTTTLEEPDVIDERPPSEARTTRSELLRSAIGIAALALVVVGIWALAGWPWAAIATGLPIGSFYLWGEVRAVRGPGLVVHREGGD